ncbi:MAG: hypothetical protein IJ849_12445 [Selenomonadaceae bacterium]|nr:hypothetical protein [Selenomonadaceae bacterium]
MGLLGDGFDIDAYVRKRLMAMDQLTNRELYKEIIADMMVGLYHQVETEYDLLEKRVFAEVPRAHRMPTVITALTYRKDYDVTDKYLFPMRAEDLDERQIVVEEMLSAVRAGEPFFLYTCFFAEDHLELTKLRSEARVFHGFITSDDGEVAADFILKPNQSYLKALEELHPMSRLNGLPWRPINSPYLYKLFDVYVVGLEEWPDKVEAELVTGVKVDYEEYAEKVKHDLISLWNIRPVNIQASAYPQPALERGYYEHYLYKSQFTPEYEYLLRSCPWNLRGLRWVEGDLYILCDGEMPGDWPFYEFSPAPPKPNYAYPLMSNQQNDTFSQNMIEHFGQRIKTKGELIRYLESFPFTKEHFTIAEVKLCPTPRERETYSAESFIAYEFRSGEQNEAILVSFAPKDSDFYLNRDLVSFLMTGVQHFFPEYACIGRLV